MTKKVIDFSNLPKQEYMKPAMRVVKLQHKCKILSGSPQNFGMNRNLQTPANEEDCVDEGW